MLRCVLRQRIVTSVSYRSKYLNNTCCLINHGTRQVLWAELLGKSISSPTKLCIKSKCSSTRPQDLLSDLEENALDKSEIKKTKKVQGVRRKKRESKKEQNVTIQNESGLETHAKTTRKKRSKKDTIEGLTVDVSNHKTLEQIEGGIEAPPSLSFPFDGSSYSEVDDEFGIFHHSSPDFPCPGEPSVVHKMDSACSKDRFYEISSEGVSVFFPSVTTVLSNTVSRSQYYRLRNWKRSMIKEHGEAEFESIQQQTRDTGSHFHQKLEHKLRKLVLPDAISIKPQGHLPANARQAALSRNRVVPFTNKVTSASVNVEGLLNAGDKVEDRENVDQHSGFYVKSVEHVLEQITSVLALESVVTHHELGYTGTFDCIAKYRDEVCLIDWKSSSKPKPTLTDCYDFPLQAVAYAGAVNHDDHYPFKVFNAVIVVAYADGAPADAHFLSHEQCQYYWGKWLHRLQEYQTQFASDHSNVY